MAISANSGWQWQLTQQFDGIARLAQVTGQHTAAAHLLGAHDALREQAGMPILVDEGASLDQLRTAVSMAIGDDAYAAAVAIGQTMPRDDAITAAHAVLTRVIASESGVSAAGDSVRGDTTARAGRDRHDLSPRELDVLRLLVEGQSDREIAEQLFISYRTVTTHVRSILNKLGVDSRTAAATYAVRHHLLGST